MRSIDILIIGTETTSNELKKKKVIKIISPREFMFSLRKINKEQMNKK